MIETNKINKNKGLVNNNEKTEKLLWKRPNIIYILFLISGKNIKKVKKYKNHKKNLFKKRNETIKLHTNLKKKQNLNRGNIKYVLIKNHNGKHKMQK